MLKEFPIPIEHLVNIQNPRISAITLDAEYPKDCIVWSSVGIVDVDFAREFANYLLAECDRVDAQRKTFFSLTLAERKEFVNQLLTIQRETKC